MKKFDLEQVYKQCVVNRCSSKHKPTNTNTANAESLDEVKKTVLTTLQELEKNKSKFSATMMKALRMIEEMDRIVSPRMLEIIQDKPDEPPTVFSIKAEGKKQESVLPSSSFNDATTS